jgi:two-component system, NtrC family, sensor histidine kinase HydH
MKHPPDTSGSDLHQKMRWLIVGRFLFAILLLCSTLLIQFGSSSVPFSGPVKMLFFLILGLFLFSLTYRFLYNRFKYETALAYGQITIDTIFVSLIIHVTGGYTSIFSFIYMVVIIYSSILLFRKGSFIVATLCSIQYAALIQAEYLGIINSVLMNNNYESLNLTNDQVFFKITITVSACYAVAFLSSVLSEQAKKSKDELLTMEEHVKMVEKMAYMGEMAAHLAHEIKNPLASLSGSIQLLREETTYNPDHDKLMQIVLRETDRLSTLVTNFLLFARPQTGNPVKLDLEKALSEFVLLFDKNESYNGRVVVKARLVRGVHVFMDPVHLRQVVLNLMINAAEAIEGKGCVELAMYPVKPNLGEISITDDGCGISDDIVHSIFDPFFTTKTNGTGLGLSIVHNLLETYGSRLDITSRPGNGTQIRFRLERVYPNAPPT